MQKHILVAGVGYLGSRIVSGLAAAGYRVYGLCRGNDKAQVLQSLGAMSLLGDVETGGGLEHLPAVDGAVFCAAPSGHEERDYRHLYLNGTAHFIAALKGKSPNAKIVYTSSTSVWGASQQGVVTEETVPIPENEKSRILLETESRFFLRGNSVVLRLAGIYGPARNRLGPLLKGFPARRPENQIANLIHVDDAAAAVILALDSAPKGSLYIVCDDEPVPQREIDAWIKQQAGLSQTTCGVISDTAGKRLSNQKIRALGLMLQYSNYRAGYEAILKNELTNIQDLP